MEEEIRPRLKKAQYNEFLTWKKNKALSNERRVLVIGDTHEPFCLDGYLDFCVKIRDKYHCNTIIHIGDVVDHHYSSFHDTDPDGFSGGDELDLTIHKLKAWREEFPKLTWIKGNHVAIIERKAFSGGLSRRAVRPLPEIYEVPEWNLKESYELDDVLYQHGIGKKANARIKTDMISTVQGHHHTEANITYAVGAKFKVWGFQVGCGIDKNAYAMAYGKHFQKPSIGCGVILENGRLPILEMMEL